MKITVIHGDDVEKSSARLNSLKTSVKSESKVVSVFAADSKIFLESFLNSSLFNENKVDLIININNLDKKNLQHLLRYLSTRDSDTIIFQDTFINKAILDQLPPNSQIETFKIPAIIFNFLDSFYPGNCQKALSLLHQALKNSSPEIIFFLLARQIKEIIYLRNNPDLVTSSSWKLAKLKQIFSFYKNGKIPEIINELSRIDVIVKTSDQKLIDLLDQLIIKYLE